MKSSHVLTIHTSTFIAFTAGSISSPFLATRFQNFFSSPYYLASMAVVMAGTMASWKIFGGCPFTVWENRLRNAEKAGSAYLGSCLPYYSQKWFGLNFPSKVYTGILVLLLILPIIAGIL